MVFTKMNAKRSGVSFTPNVELTSSSRKDVNKFVELYEERLKRGKELCLLKSGMILKRLIIENAKGIDGIDYNELKVVLIGGEPPSVALVFESANENLSDNISSGAEARSIYYVRPKAGAPEWVQSIAEASPWVSSLMPIKPKASEANLIRREVTASERDRVASQNREALSRLKGKLGGKGEANLKRVLVNNDLGFKILRIEFGYGEKQVSHWRPALQDAMMEIKRLGSKLGDFLVNGNERVFDIDEYNDYSESSLAKLDGKFGTVIGKSVGLKK